jgi:hypothetical protein
MDICEPHKTLLVVLFLREGISGVAYKRVYMVACLPHARKVELQNQLFLSNARTNNGTAVLRNPFLG